MKQRLFSVLANALAWLGTFLVSWAIYSQFDTQAGRAGIYAAAVTLTALLQIIFWTQEGEWLAEFSLGKSSMLLIASIGFVTLKGFIDLLFVGHTSPSIPNIQEALQRNSRWGMLLTLILAVIFVTGFALTTLRLMLRRLFGLDASTQFD